MDFDSRRILDAFSDAVVAADRDGCIVYANRKTEALLGWEDGTLSGNPLTAIVPPRLQEAHRDGFDRYVTTREARLIGHPVRVPALRRDGSELEIELTLAAFHEPQGDLIVASLRDLTERVELERQLTVTGYLRAATAAAAKLTTHLDLQAVLDIVVNTLVEDFDSALARIWLYQPETRELYLRASAGLSAETVRSSRAIIDVQTYPYKVGVVARSRQPFIRNGLLGDPDFEQEWVEREGLRSVAGFPLLIGGELRGVLVYFSRRELHPEVAEVLGTFAAMVSASINDVQLFEREQAARKEAEAATGRLQELQTVTDAALAHLGLEELLRELQRRLCGLLRCDTATILLLSEDGQELRVRAALGLEQEVRRGITVPVGRGVAGRIATSRKLTIIEDLTQEEVISPILRDKVRSLIGAPLVVEDRLVGVVHLGTLQTRRFTQAEGQLLQLAADRMALGIEQARLYEEAQQARVEADEARAAAEAQAAELHVTNEELLSQHEELQQLSEELRLTNQDLQQQQTELEERSEALREQQRRTTFLAEASLLLGSSLDYETTLRSVARLAVPETADWCAIDMADAEGRLQRLAVAHVDPMKVALVQQLYERYPPRPEDPHGAPNVLRTGEPELYPDLTDDLLVALAQDPEHLRILRELRLVSGIAVPLTARGEVLGVLTLVAAESGRRYGSADLRFAQDLARRAGMAVDNARLHADLQEANHQKDRFLAMLAHELRNPLAAISNAGHVLERLELQPAAGRLTRVVTRQSTHLARMVDDLLDVSRITRGSVELQKELVELGPVVERASETARPQIEARGHTLTIERPERPIRLLADATRLEQILVNLLQNAAKFTEPGGQISATVGRRGDEAVVRVRDTGIGIPKELLPRVFDLFTQGDQSLARTTGGLGIGLTLVKSLAELHGGSVVARSEGPGRGSEFEVRLPVLREARLRATAASSEAATVPATRLRVLVVDDDADSAETLADLLRVWGHEVQVAFGSARALELAATFQPQAVLCDLGLPEMDGYGVASALRGAPETATARLVAVSGYGGLDVTRRCREAGFDLHLTKPVEPDALRTLLATPPDPAATGGWMED